MTGDLITKFVAESNRIEGITRDPLPHELDVSAKFLEREFVTVDALCDFVCVCQPGAVLRTRFGEDVVVGDYHPPPGGPEIETRLRELVERANLTTIHVQEPLSSYFTHQRYERLHPFTDGNGRSGRILWAWQMVRLHGMRGGLGLGFLHRWYYQSLAAPA